MYSNIVAIGALSTSYCGHPNLNRDLGSFASTISLAFT
jgi:hypothetical protein